MKKLSLLALLAWMPFVLSAWDLGITETEATVGLEAKVNSPVLTQSSKTVAHLDLPLGLFNFHLEGQADISATYASSAWTVSNLRLDAGLVNLSGFIPLGQAQGVIDLSVGRRNVTDLSGGWVLGSRLDGASISYLSGGFHLDLRADYSGLVLKQNSKVGLGADDTKDSADSTKLFAPSRAIAALNLGLNELFLRQDVQWENLAQYDLRTSSGAVLVHSGYSTLGLSGPLFLGFRHQTTVTGEVLLTDMVPTYAILAATQWTANIAGGKVVLDAAWARGLGSSTAMFVPIAGKGLASVTSLSTANGAFAQVDYSFSPLSKLNVGLKADGLFNGNPGQAVGLTGFQSGSTALWLGSEATLYGSWSLTSELSLGWNLGTFYPNPDAVVSGTPMTYLAVLTATLEL